MSNFVVPKDQMDRVLNPQRHDAPICLPNISLPNLGDLTLRQRMMAIPSNPTALLREFPNTIVQMVEGGKGLVGEIAELSTDLGNEVANLPQRVYSWPALLCLLFGLVMVPLVAVGVVFFIPLQSVNEGVDRKFVFIFSTIYEGLFLIAWVETFNFAQVTTDPKTKLNDPPPPPVIPTSSRLVAWFASLVGCFTFKVLLVEGGHVYPIPFSILVVGMLSVFFVLAPAMYWLTPKKDRAPFSALIKLIGVYWISLCIVTFWAVGVNRLRHQPAWQMVVGVLYAPLRFVCKVVIASPVAAAVNQQRWIPLNLVIDMLFTRVQVATFPFIDSITTFLLLSGSEIITLAWRYYDGVDRVAIWWHTIRIPQGNFWQITKSCIRLPVVKVADLHNNINKETKKPDAILRSMTGETESISSETSSSIESGGEQEDCANEYLPKEACDYKEAMPIRIAKKKVSFVYPSSLDAIADIEEACDMADEQVLGITRRLEGEGPLILMIQTLAEDSDEESVVSVSLDDDFKNAQGANDNMEQSYYSSSLPDYDVASLQLPQAHNTIHRHLSLVSSSSTKTIPQDVYCMQRVLYHIVDSTGAIVISIVTRIAQQLCITMVRSASSSAHLNQSFQISDERWFRAQIFGWCYVGLMIFLLGNLGCLFFKRLDGFQDALSLRVIMSYLFRDHFWFFFFWLLGSGVLVSASMVNHFGADFSFGFEWVGCPIDQMAWPECKL